MKKVLVIGFGNIAKRHRKNLKLILPNIKVYGMSASGGNASGEVDDCDLIVETISEAIAASIDFAIIASPATLHAEHAAQLIKQRVPVLIEKPVTVNIEDAQYLMGLSEKHNVAVAVGYCLRYLPSAKKVYDLLRDEKFGDLYNAFIQVGQYLPDWRPSKYYRESVSAVSSLGGGALWELSHEFDYALWLLGDLQVTYAKLRSSSELSLDVEDMVDTVLTTNDGAVCNIHLDFLQKSPSRTATFIGSNARLDWDLIKNTLVLSNKEKTEVLYSEAEWDKNSLYTLMLKDFISKIKGEANQCIDLVSAIDVVKLVLASKECAKGH